MSELTIVQPTVVRRPARYRGGLDSASWNDFMEEVVSSIHDLASAVNTISNKLSRSLVVVNAENAHLRRLVDTLKNQQDYVERVAGRNGYLGIRLIDLSDTTGITFPGGFNDDHSAMVSAEFGQATLPALAIENRFYTLSVRNGRVIEPPGLSPIVRGTFDKGDGNGLVDYERGGKVSAGKPEWAFNGNNQQFWIRRVEFPLDSKVDEVECELKVAVPEGASSQANLIEILPFPNGAVDVIQLSTSSDLGDSFTTVPGFSALDNLKAKRYHFPTINVEQVKIRLRQRNWIEEDGKKVFYYGLQELGLKLVDYDKEYTAGAAFGSNHSFVIRIDAPTGFVFTNIYAIDPTPNFLNEDSGKRHIHLRLSSSADFAGQFWDSDTNLPPQNTVSPIAVGNIPTIYAIVELNFVTSSGGGLSPYPVGTTPFLEGLGLSFTLSVSS